MNKEYYNNVLKEEIKFLLEKVEDLNLEISSIATEFEYHNENDDVSLDRLSISAINEKRKQVFTLTELIRDLDNLKKGSEQ